MLPLLGAIIGGGASLLGGMMQNNAAKDAARDQMAFQKESAQHSYQWAMKDMEKAGLNPILAYKQGGAGTLSGSSYTPQNVGAAAVTGASSGASSAMAAQRNQAELANIQADTALKASQDKTQSALQIQAMAQAGQANANSALAFEQAHQSRWQSTLINSQLMQNMPKETLARLDDAFYKSEAAAPLITARRWAEALQPVGAAASALNPFK